MSVFIASFAWAVIIPISLTAPPGALFTAAFLAGLSLFGGALMLVLWSAVSPKRDHVTAWRRAGLLLAITLTLWVPTHMWSERGEQPWAWLAGFAVSACALMSWRQGAAMAVVLGTVAAIGGIVFHGSVLTDLLTLLGCAAVVLGMCHMLVWLLRLLWTAQTVRETQTELALAEERLRVSRELHDVLGHRLGIIALKAELAADLTTRDARGAETECEGIRRLAAETLVEVRRAVHGETGADLATQLRSAELVLSSAGIDARIEADPEALARLGQEQSRLLAAVVREALTNVLRHSDARDVSIALTATGRVLDLVIVNDGVRRSRRSETSGGTGLSALSDRCAAAGAQLTVERDTEHLFRLRVACPTDGTHP